MTTHLMTQSSVTEEEIMEEEMWNCELHEEEISSILDRSYPGFHLNLNVFAASFQNGGIRL